MITALVAGLGCQALAESVWIGVPKSTTHGEPKFTKIFKSDAGGVQKLHICGLGQYVAYLNGEKVGGERDVLTPGWTDARKTCIYDTYDVTLKPGENRLDVILTGGMYTLERTPGRYQKFSGHQGDRKLKVWGAVESDPSWTVSESGVIFASVYGGDDVDGRMWLNNAQPTIRQAQQVPPPAGELVAANFRIKLFAKHVGVNCGDHWKFDENLAYVPEIRVKGKAGAKVRIQMAECWDTTPKKTLRDACGWSGTWCTYTLKGDPKGETWRPPFFYRGFQFATLTLQGEVEVQEFCAYEVHADCEQIGTFECGNDMLNRIYHIVVNSQKSNMMSVFTDCPHREKLGWQEQYNCHSVQMRWVWDAAKVFAKCCRDITDAQLPNGLVPDICPEYVIFNGGFRDSIEWGSSVILVPMQQYEWTGDAQFIGRMWPAMVKYMDYIQSKSKNGIAPPGLGDWIPLDRTPHTLSAQAWWYWDALAMSELAQSLGKIEDVKKYSELAKQIAKDFDREFWNPAKNCYCNGQQAAQALAVGLNLAATPEKRDAALKQLIADIEKRGMQNSTGELAYPFLLKALQNHGYGQYIYDMTIRDDKPGYGYMVKQGLTSLHEDWACGHGLSYNHFMFGDIVEWLYEGLAGIRRVKPAFAEFRVEPFYPRGLDYVRATHRIPETGGVIEVAWRAGGEGTELTVTVPKGSVATVVTPSGEKVRQEPGTRSYR